MSGFTLERPIVMHALTYAVIVASVFVAAVTIFGELIVIDGAKIIKNWLAETHGHHWVGKGIWTLILFAVSGFIGYMTLKLRHVPTPAKLVRVAAHIALWMSILITLFFIYEYVVAH